MGWWWRGPRPLAGAPPWGRPSGRLPRIPAARPAPRRPAEVNSILSDTMGILQQFLAASSAGAGAMGAPLPPSASELQPSDPFR